MHAQDGDCAPSSVVEAWNSRPSNAPITVSGLRGVMADSCTEVYLSNIIIAANTWFEIEAVPENLQNKKK